MGNQNKIKKAMVYETPKDIEMFEYFSRNFKKRLTKEDKETIVKNIESKHNNITRQKKIEERKAFRDKLLKKRKLKNISNLAEEDAEFAVLKSHLPDSKCRNNNDVSVVSRLPLIERERVLDVVNISCMLPLKSEQQKKAKNFIDIAADQANSIFFKRLAGESNEQQRHLLFTKGANNNSKNPNLSLPISASTWPKMNKIEDIEVIKPEKYLQVEEANVHDKDESPFAKNLTFQNLVLQEHKFDAIIKNIEFACKHPACKHFYQKYIGLQLTGENAFSFIRRNWFFEMEMFENRWKLNEGNIRQICFLPKLYDVFLKQCLEMQRIGKQINSTESESNDIQNCKWTVLNTTIDSPNEVDFDLKYICAKEDISINDCSIVNMQLVPTDEITFKPQIRPFEIETHRDTNKENYCNDIELSSFVKPIQKNSFKMKQQGLVARANEFQRVTKKLKNIMPASSNKEVFKTENVSATNDSFASLTNNSDLPPWFKPNSKKIDKKLVLRSPLKNISRNRPQR